MMKLDFRLDYHYLSVYPFQLDMDRYVSSLLLEKDLIV